MSAQLSVIIPVYNAEDTIGRCLSSLACQDLDGVEIICINDGSSDQSLEICKDYSSKYKEIVVYSQVNRGVSAARNYGISVAHGKYITFVDSDDYVSKNYFALLKGNLANADMIQFGYFQINQYGEKKCMPNALYKGLHSNILDLYEAISSCENIFASWNKVYRKEILEKNNIAFPVGVITGEDMRFILDYAKAIKTIFVIEEPLYVYCYNSTSCTHSGNIKYLQNYLENYNILKRAISTFPIQVGYQKIKSTTFNLLYDSVVQIKKEHNASNLRIKQALPAEFINELVTNVENTTISKRVRVFLLRNGWYGTMKLVDIVTKKFKDIRNIKQ